MNNLLVMKVLSTFGDVESYRGEKRRIVLEKAALLTEDIGEASSGHELCNDTTRLGANADELDHVRMIQLTAAGRG